VAGIVDKRTAAGLQVPATALGGGYGFPLATRTLIEALLPLLAVAIYGIEDESIRIVNYVEEEIPTYRPLLSGSLPDGSGDIPGNLQYICILYFVSNVLFMICAYSSLMSERCLIS
jgi:hypothetical protein